MGTISAVEVVWQRKREMSAFPILLGLVLVVCNCNEASHVVGKGRVELTISTNLVINSMLGQTAFVNYLDSEL